MLEELSIHDIAIINELTIRFDQGLNILSGETGAGKSILIDAIGFVMGGKAGKNFVKAGKDKGMISGVLVITQGKTRALIQELGIALESDHRLHIVRTVDTSGKTTLRLNGKTAPLGALKEITAGFIDIHGQFEHQYLQNEAKHIQILDQFCDSKMEKLKQKLSQTIEGYKDISTQITAIETQAQEVAVLREEVETLASYDLKAGEEETLTRRLNFLSHYKEIASGSIAVMELIESEDAAMDKIAMAIKYLREVVSLDPTKQPLLDILENVSIQLEEVVRTLNGDATYYDPQELLILEDRLEVILGANRRYKKTTEEILTHYEKLQITLDQLENSKSVLKQLKQERQQKQTEMLALCDQLTNLRETAKAQIEKEIVTNLVDLGMKNVQFKIELKKKATFSREGNDTVQFLIAPNLGAALKPLAQIASGGEMSRVMLALKVVLSQANSTETFIFDEIDTGVSGRTAQKVGLKLKELAKHRQILCISHLPQIAAMGDRHFLIEKIQGGGETTSHVSELSASGIIKELARLIGGAKITETTLRAAEEMKTLNNPV